MTEALESGDFKELVDPRLGTNYIETEMFRMVETAAACIRHSASRRPKMSQVLIFFFFHLKSPTFPQPMSYYKASPQIPFIHLKHVLQFHPQSYVYYVNFVFFF